VPLNGDGLDGILRKPLLHRTVAGVVGPENAKKKIEFVFLNKTSWLFAFLIKKRNSQLSVFRNSCCLVIAHILCCLVIARSVGQWHMILPSPLMRSPSPLMR
jgi:hypothetical protein